MKTLTGKVYVNVAVIGGIWKSTASSRRFVVRPTMRSVLSRFGNSGDAAGR